MNAINIAGSGLLASVARLNASASNVANINTVGPVRKAAPSGTATDRAGPYQPVEIRQEAVPGGGVSSIAALRRPSSVPVADPASPMADDQGMVAAPNVDPVRERIEQTAALRAYQANLSVIRTADTMEGALLDRRA